MSPHPRDEAVANLWPDMTPGWRQRAVEAARAEYADAKDALNRAYMRATWVASAYLAAALAVGFAAKEAKLGALWLAMIPLVLATSELFGSFIGKTHTPDNQSMGMRLIDQAQEEWSYLEFQKWVNKADKMFGTVRRHRESASRSLKWAKWTVRIVPFAGVGNAVLNVLH